MEERKECIEEEYDPKVDWSKLEVDTPILVRVSPAFPWIRAHFADFKDGRVRVFVGGRTSYTNGKTTPLAYDYARLFGVRAGDYLE